mmetsp:Transcript_58268/g.103459  ORF Transcript_58268/g.103459 Transcript_58268/m.103459 type:complete len:128 (+) Transcript_58268:45-428(+)
MSLTTNPDCTQWKEVTDKEARAYAFKMLSLRRGTWQASSSPSLSKAGTMAVNIEKRPKFLAWRSSITAGPVPNVAPHMTPDQFKESLAGEPGAQKTIYVRSRPPDYFASWGGRPAPPGGPDFKQGRR